MPTRLNFRNGPLKVSNTCWRQNWPIKIVTQLSTPLSGTDSSWALNFWVSRSLQQITFLEICQICYKTCHYVHDKFCTNLKRKWFLWQNNEPSRSIKPCSSYSMKLVLHVFMGSIVPSTCSANWSETFGVITQTQWQNAKKVIKKPAKKSMPYL